jgi:hypothetical protein
MFGKRDLIGTMCNKEHSSREGTPLRALLWNNIANVDAGAYRKGAEFAFRLEFLMKS